MDYCELHNIQQLPEHHITDIFSHINNNDYGIGKKPTHGVVKNVGLNFGGNCIKLYAN